MRSGRLDWTLFVGAIGILAAVSVALVTAPGIGIALAVMVGLGCVAMIARVPLAHVGASFVVMFAFTASWDEVEIAGVTARYLFLLFGLVILGLTQATKRLPPIPWWVHCFGLTAITVAALQTLLPVPQDYLNSRYLTAEGGFALGFRPDALPALTYLAVNVYLVPTGIVLAVMAVPNALRSIIYAFVAGVALSSLAAYLGFIGLPWLVELFATPVPAGIRAPGYTLHSLRLATSCVMAAALAVWMAVQPRFAVRWLGRMAVVAIALGLYASGSRGGNVAGLLALALCVLLLPAIRQRWHTVLAGVVSIVALVLAFVPTVGAQILTTTRIAGGTSSQVSSSERGQIFEQAIADFAQSPIYGIGPRYLAEAHVLYAGVLASGGVLLFAGYVLFNVGSIRDAFRAMKVNRALGGALMATLIASLTYWLVADEFTGAVVQSVYGILIALVLPHLRPNLTSVLGSPSARSASDPPAEPSQVRG